MKIQGPGQPPQPPDGKPKLTDGAPEVGGGKPQSAEGAQKTSDFASLAETDRAAGANGAKGVAEPGKAAEASPSRSVLPPDVVSEIAGKVRAGEVSRSEAFDLIVERVLDRQLGPEAPAQVRNAVRERMAELLETDPFMAQQMDQLMRDSAK